MVGGGPFCDLVLPVAAAGGICRSKKKAGKERTLGFFPQINLNASRNNSIPSCFNRRRTIESKKKRKTSRSRPAYLIATNPTASTRESREKIRHTTHYITDQPDDHPFDADRGTLTHYYSGLGHFNTPIFTSRGERGGGLFVIGSDREEQPF